VSFVPEANSHLDVTDLELMQRARRGDHAAFQELVDRHAGALYGAALSLTGNAADAEELLQETWTGAWEGAGRFEERSSVKTWLTRILIRQSARHHRSRRARRSSSLHEVSEASKALMSAPEGLSSAEAAQVRADVAAVLDMLSPEHRQVIVLREFQGLTYEEMAEVLGVPIGTVESRLFRAREELKKRLSAYLP